MVIIRQLAPAELGRAKAHGLDPFTARDWLAEQDFACAICGEPSTLDRPLVMDHDHTHCTRTVGCAACCRGFLCESCNSRVGVLEKLPRFDPTPYIAYIERWRGAVS